MSLNILYLCTKWLPNNISSAFPGPTRLVQDMLELTCLNVRGFDEHFYLKEGNNDSVRVFSVKNATSNFP